MSFGLPWPLAVAVALAVAVLLGVLVERLVLRPLVGESAIAVIMVTIGLAAVLRAVVQLIWGTTPRAFPDFIPESSLQVAGARIPVNKLWAVGLAGLVLLAFSLVFQRSRQGIAMRAVADDQQAALVVGISVRRIFALAWALAQPAPWSAGSCSPTWSESPVTSPHSAWWCFPWSFSGGSTHTRNPGRRLIIGLLAEYTSAYIDPKLQEVVPFAVLVLILLVRPYGLFGQARIERV